ncbi:MAG: substrate-binding domain-containing protein [Ruminococcus sp.]
MESRLLIGVITTNCYTDYQSEIMRGIVSQAFKSSCDIAVICPLHDFFFDSRQKNQEKSILSLISCDAFAGFLYDRNSFSDKIRDYIDKLCLNSGKPVMLLDYNGHNQFETTTADDCAAFEEITDHLIEVHGYKKIICLTGPKGTFSGEERLKGYLRSMKKHGLTVERSGCLYGDFWTDAPVQLAEQIISGDIEKPEAIVCGNDVMAYTLIDRLINSGINVPEDIAVTGFDATAEASLFTPSVTSYKRPNYQLGSEAFRRLYRIITGRICSKVPNESGVLRIGHSCGCAEDAELRRQIQHRMKNEERIQNKMFFGDMLIDITSSADIPALIEKIDNYSYLLHKMNQIYICITENFEQSLSSAGSAGLYFDISKPLRIVYSKSAIERGDDGMICSSASDALDYFRNSRKNPSAFYISPLHYNENFFGFAAVSFGKQPVTYSRIYIQWINYINMALEKVRIQSAMNQAVNKLNSLASCDNTSGLLNLSGLKNAFRTAFHKNYGSISSVTYVHIELTDLHKIFIQNGSEAAGDMIKGFGNILKKLTKKDEICAVVSSGCFGVIMFGNDRSEQLYCGIKQQLSSVQTDDISFTLGCCSCNINEEMPQLSKLIHNAAVNRIHTHSKSETPANQHFEKLRQLRNDIMKNPEMNWNISEIADKLFISKSYLQKIYKSTFGKSIIEELIQFRLDKAREMLLNTDLTVSEIAHECGYSTYNYFVRQFKAAENISPSDYRLQMQNENKNS